MGVVRQGVEKHIGKPKPRQIIIELYARSKDQSLGNNPPAFGLLPQVANRGGIILPQPQHAAVDRQQQAHPDIEYRRSNFVVIIETAKYKPALGQPTGAS